jgi:hypothetical protein
MNRRSLLLLGGSAVVVTGAAILLGPRQGAGPDPGQAPLMFDNLAGKLAGAMRIEVKRHDATLVVQRQPGDVWVLPDKANYPVRAEKLHELLAGLTELRLVEPRTANPEMLERLGLQDPMQAGSTASLLRVLDGSGTPIAELVIGRRRMRTQGNMPESVYLRRPTETQAWLAEGRLPVDADPQLWINRDIANIPHERVLKAEVEHAGEPALVLTRGDGPDAHLAVTEPAATPPLEESSLDEVARAFEYLTLTDVRAVAAMPGESLGRARFTLTDRLAILAEVNRDGEAVWVRLSAEGDAEAATLNDRWRGWAYQVGPWKAKALVPRLEDLRRVDPPAAGAPSAEAPETSDAPPQAAPAP